MNKRTVVLIALALLCIVGSSIYYLMARPADSDEVTKIGVHVKGAVVQSGYYELETGSRVKDAIDAAGGASENADLNEINLAAFLYDGDEVSVPYIFYGKVNVNSASKAELEAVDGIGKSLAASIITYRNRNGAFSTLEELRRVEGVSESVYSRIIGSLTLE